MESIHPEIDVDQLIKQIETLKQASLFSVHTVGQGHITPILTLKPVHRPSWNGKLEVRTNIDKDDRNNPFKCGR